MVTKPDSNKARLKRHARVRGKISGTAECPRLDVFRSNSNIYAQLIDVLKSAYLTAADIFTTAVSRSWPKEPVRAASSSKEGGNTFG